MMRIISCESEKVSETRYTRVLCFSFKKKTIRSYDFQQDGNIEWDKKTQGMVLGSFFWGYLASQIPAGWLATRIGGKWLFGVAMLVAAMLTIITPVVAENTFVGLMVVRILLGAASVREFRVLLE